MKGVCVDDLIAISSAAQDGLTDGLGTCMQLIQGEPASVVELFAGVTQVSAFFGSKDWDYEVQGSCSTGTVLELDEILHDCTILHDSADLRNVSAPTGVIPLPSQRQNGTRLAVCAPPRSVSITQDETDALEAVYTSLGIEIPRHTAWTLAGIALYLAGEQGAAAILMENAQLSRMAWRIGQRRFVEHHYISAIIKLPTPFDVSYADEQGVSVDISYDAIVLLQRNSETIQFVAPSCNDERTEEGKRSAEHNVSLRPEDVIANDYLLIPDRYLTPPRPPKNAKPFSQFSTVVRGIPKNKLSSVAPLQATNSKRAFYPSRTCAHPAIAYITSKDFQHGRNYLLDADRGFPCSARYYNSADITAQNIKPFSGPRLVLSRTGHPYKACLIDQNSFAQRVDGYLLADNLFAIEVTEGVDPVFLLAFLTSSQGQQILNQTASGTSTLRQISPRDLRNASIPIPDVTVQAAIAKAYTEHADRLLELEQTARSLTAERENLFAFDLMG